MTIIIKIKERFLVEQLLVRREYLIFLVVEENRNCNKALSMENADKVRMHFYQDYRLNDPVWQGVGALYVIIDTIKRKRAEQRELEEKQKQEETFHNGVNKGRELLKPL